MALALYTRPREVLMEVIRENAGQCQYCDETLAFARFAWDHRITDDMYRPGPWKLGEDSFTLLRHASGKKPCWTDTQDLAKPTCGTCGAVDLFEVKQEAYGDSVTCTACGKNTWHPIGD
ncbi:hypothetical protein [Micromonospora sp. NPDC005652]|uniref:hypothetical protein n=1 Tax=Micromonospora sp. NPDC005652 TaxID=3157046 RepID=UPI0033E58FCA